MPHQHRTSVWISAGQEDCCALLEEYGHTFYGDVDAACLALKRWTSIVKGKYKNFTHLWSTYKDFFFCFGRLNVLYGALKFNGTKKVVYMACAVHYFLLTILHCNASHLLLCDPTPVCDDAK